ncbi:hypothetical protein KSP35_15360 [Aquihabitans sp. G128]|uniref:hypothetical protein n=1 Tax=Aquihabitans sp. G128 TaxID=2849779 RepID=UPI001C229647|nr:hypothetical protein [Aquihabitans sp. G128]QXC59750.1 hypothetical protein KSP35_15360 [Aquihabitans sp. G128]
MGTTDVDPSALESWQRAAGTYWGPGDGAESGPFAGRVEVVARPEAVELDYEAWAPGRGLLHRERAVLAVGPHGLQLATAISELPDELRFVHDGIRFELIADAPYAMAVALDVVDGSLSWAWYWAAIGQAPVLQSRLRAARAI